MGSLELIIGPMFSGKTTELMRRINRHRAIGHQSLIINSIKDTRCLSQIMSHDNTILEAVKLEKLEDLLSQTEIELSNFHVVAIDESQFFSSLVQFVTKTLIGQFGLHVIVTGLNGDFQQNLFGETMFLIPHAERVDLLHGLCTECRDGTAGCYSKRIITSNTQTLVGGKESYRCVCRKHLTD